MLNKLNKQTKINSNPAKHNMESDSDDDAVEAIFI